MSQSYNLMPGLREQAREDPRFKVTDDGAVTVNTDHEQWERKGEVILRATEIDP